MQPIIRTYCPESNPARVVFPRQIVTQARIEVSIDIKYISFAMLTSLDDGLVGRQGLANPKASSSVTITTDDQRTIANGRATPLDLLDSIYFDCTVSPLKDGFHKAEGMYISVSKVKTKAML